MKGVLVFVIFKKQIAESIDLHLQLLVVMYEQNLFTLKKFPYDSSPHVTPQDLEEENT